jgi:hypothetical protein
MLPQSTREPAGTVATDWAPVIQTGIGALAALCGGFLGAWWQARAQQRIERDRRQRRTLGRLDPPRPEDGNA